MNDNQLPIQAPNSKKNETESKVFVPQSISELIAGVDTKIEWIIPNILPSEGVAIFSAPPSHFKSWLMHDLALSCAKGEMWLDHFACATAKVLYIDEESSKSLLKHRLQKLINGTDTKLESLDVHFLVGQGLNFSEPSSLLELRVVMGKIKPQIVIIDSLIRVHQADENSARDMARVFGVIKDLVREFKCCFVLADHQRKSNNFGGGMEQLLRGTSEKGAFVDTLLSIKRHEQMIIVEHSKSRMVQPVPSFLVEVKDVNHNTTRTLYAGEVEAQKQQEHLKGMKEFLESVLSPNEWISRKELVRMSKDEEIPVKRLDQGLKYFAAEGMIDHDQQKAPGRGGKSDVYRWHVDTKILFQSVGMETGNVKVKAEEVYQPAQFLDVEF